MLIFSKKNNKISQCFYDHIEHVADCFENTEKFFQILCAEYPDRNLLESSRAAIDSSEHAADNALRRTVDVMKEAFLPVTRSNLIALVQSVDHVANSCQSITRQIWLEKVTLPRELWHDTLEILSITKTQLKYLYTAIDKVLNDFGDIAKDKSILEAIRTEESKVDRIENLLHSRIFTQDDLSLVEKVYYRDLILHVCKLSDIIEDIADQIQIMIVEREA
jgi:predicted phosphate transport protein (TIGR00153 family)